MTARPLRARIDTLLTQFTPAWLDGYDRPLPRGGIEPAAAVAARWAFYARSYPAHLATARAALSDGGPRPEGVFQIVAAAYPWMPRVPTSVDLEGARAAFRTAWRPEGRGFAQILPQRPVVNRSWTGTAKALHFVNPALCPIWDSRIDAALFPKRQGARRPPERTRLITYAEALSAAAKGAAVPGIVAALERAYGTPPVTPLRAAEWAIFCAPPAARKAIE
ncbi:MAG: hypothetical protein AAGF60_07710 [Pseudomonadota bacterium]